MKKNVLIALMFLVIPFTASAITVEVPPANYQDIVSGPSQKVQTEDSTLLKTLEAINFYLWFVLGVVALAVLVYGWYGLMTAEGDEKKLKQANDIMYNAAIGVFICIFAYVIVRVVINLL